MPNSEELYVGLMSGTSLDGIDTVLVSFNDDSQPVVSLIETEEYAFPEELRGRLLKLVQQPDSVSLDELGVVDRMLGLNYAAAVKSLLSKADITNGAVKAIGNHGQTIRHRTDIEPAFTMQIGDAATVANETGIITVGDFRSADIALHGQGAPLASSFHAWAFGSQTQTNFVVNLGGIANITVLEPGEPAIGFDTGPANTLLDIWCQHHKQLPFDKDGAWAAQGKVAPTLLSNMLDDPYFALGEPKSTGREYFNDAWLQQKLAGYADVQPVDVQATLAELTARTVANDIARFAANGNVWLCGGGAQNSLLTSRLTHQLPEFSVATTADLGVPPTWVEAVAFAWLARQRLMGRATGLPSVTGARASGMLGSINLPAEA